MYQPQDLQRIVEQRLEHTRAQRQRSRAEIGAGRPDLAEDDAGRRARFETHMSGAAPVDAEKVWAEADFVDAVFLTVGARAAGPVARLVTDAGRTPLGTGFLVTPRVLITNNHVLEDVAAAGDAWAQFNYELGEDAIPRTPDVYALRPDLFFHAVSWEGLDFTLVAVGDRLSGTGSLAAQGSCPLSDRPDKHAKGATVNIVQHPGGDFKKVVLRGNRIVARTDMVLHYEADTEGGSSGSPVFNDAWEVVALHHWGSPHLGTTGPDGTPLGTQVNEGVRISAIVEALRAALPTLPAAARPYLEEVLAAPPLPRPQPGTAGLPVLGTAERSAPTQRSAPAPATVEAHLSVPLEITVRLGTPGRVAVSPGGSTTLPAPAERVRIDRDYANRRGFDPAFLPGVTLSVADIVAPVREQVAPLRSGDSRGELKYQHFSIVMNAARRLAILTATNIDGSTYIPIDRGTGQPSADAEGDTWFEDTRIDPALTVTQPFYSANSRTFDRGHLTRRSDPTWGTPERAARANADTFHFTNCSPQHWLFNESVTYWQGVERHYLEFGATLDRSRLSVLQGPVFAPDDPVYTDTAGRELRVPLQFWKLVLRVQNGALQVTAFLVSQRDLLGLPRRPVSPGGDGAAPDVTTYLTTVLHLQDLTGLDFRALAAYDTAAPPTDAEGTPLRAITSWADVP
ncbi:endonuclease G [Deinococcus metalli]|uniref:Endonuclease n=1 Tax=Deinococcus metalli TaxID=1141878 RepID=A0A7W8KGK3_9DEIO|nr:DNA/RNA non-specific endonuclease [Deinococcus metalli]MBB5377398.1 endonuclease G [Deinococcus metalli]GHF50117.1 endonuclease [Deinococcus metalli]